MNSSIKCWAEDDRPREKLLLKGKSILSDAELLAIIIGSGTRKYSALDLAKQILSDAENDLNLLSRKSVQDLMNYRGIGEAKAVSLVASLELTRRKKALKQRPVIRSSRDAYLSIRSVYEDLEHEEFHVIYLSRNNSVLGVELISKGGMSGTVADGKIIFRKALEFKSSAMILSHNHPSGSNKPSNADRTLTRSLVDFSRLIDLQILDHIIVAGNNYFSFADEGLIKQ